MPQPAQSISVPAAVLLGVAVVSSTTLAGIVVAQAAFPVRVYEGATALLASLTALTGTGVIICVVADRILRRLDQLDEKVSVQRVAFLPQSPKATSVRNLAPGERIGLDPESIAAARALARRIVEGPRVQRDAE